MPHLPIAPSDTALYAGVMVVFTQYAVASVIILGLVWANNRRNIEYLLAALTSASVAVACASAGRIAAWSCHLRGDGENSGEAESDGNGDGGGEC